MKLRMVQHDGRTWCVDCGALIRTSETRITAATGDRCRTCHDNHHPDNR